MTNLKKLIINTDMCGFLNPVFMFINPMNLCGLKWVKYSKANPNENQIGKVHQDYKCVFRDETGRRGNDVTLI